MSTARNDSFDIAGPGEARSSSRVVVRDVVDTKRGRFLRGKEHWWLPKFLDRALVEKADALDARKRDKTDNFIGPVIIIQLHRSCRV
jgi:hypothetical protein